MLISSMLSKIAVLFAAPAAVLKIIVLAWVEKITSKKDILV